MPLSMLTSPLRVQRQQSVEGWRSAISILDLFLQVCDIAVVARFTSAAAPQLTANVRPTALARALPRPTFWCS